MFSSEIKHLASAESTQDAGKNARLRLTFLPTVLFNNTMLRGRLLFWKQKWTNASPLLGASLHRLVGKSWQKSKSVTFSPHLVEATVETMELHYLQWKWKIWLPKLNFHSHWQPPDPTLLEMKKCTYQLQHTWLAWLLGWYSYYKNFQHSKKSKMNCGTAIGDVGPLQYSLCGVCQTHLASHLCSMKYWCCSVLIRTGSRRTWTVLDDPQVCCPQAHHRLLLNQRMWWAFTYVYQGSKLGK